MNAKKPHGIKHPVVSIGMPTFNHDWCIKRALDSLLSQTYTNFELIISDNSSSDNTIAICKEYARKDKRIKYFHQKRNLGALKNFSFVLEKAKGKFFMWAADDDLWNKDYIEKIMDEYTKSDSKEVGLIATKWICIDPKSTSNNYIDIEQYSDSQELTFSDFLKNAPYLATYIYGMYNKTILKKIGGFDKTPVFVSDLITILHILSISKAKIINRKLFYYGHPPVKKVRKILIGFKTLLCNLLLPGKLIYLLSIAKIYFKSTKKLIEKYHKKEKRLYFWHIVSTLKLLWLLVPCDLNHLTTKTGVD